VSTLDDAIGRLRSYVDHPGNWSALDSRRPRILALVDAVRDAAQPAAVAFARHPDAPASLARVTITHPCGCSMVGRVSQFGDPDVWRSMGWDVSELEAALVTVARALPVAFPIGARVRKVKGSSWQGRVVGHYSTTLTRAGVCVESEREPGSVQIYPVAAVERIEADQ
jgi:hypothetical protein